MKTILLNDVMISKLTHASPTEAYEVEFEAITIKILRRLYEKAFVFPFKPLIKHKQVGWKPDIALVDRSLEYWYVIEVETIDHSLERHVVPQVIAFRDGDYGDDAIKIVASSTGLPIKEAATLVNHIPRNIAVVSNYFDPNWQSVLSSENIQYQSITVFQEIERWGAVLVEGILAPPTRSVGFGIVDASNKVISLHNNSFWKNGQYNIFALDGISKWDCFLKAEKAWLIKRRGTFDFPDQRIVQFILQDDGSLSLHIPY